METIGEVFVRNWTATEVSHNKRKWLPSAMRILAGNLMLKTELKHNLVTVKI